MSFPTDPTDLTIEMQTDTDTWVDLVDGDYVLDRGITISRGRADEAGQIEPQRLTMTLDNTGGRFSPRNPLSPYYGTLGRNNPVRAYVRRGTTYLDMPDTAAYVSAPDASGLDITGDIDIRVDLTTAYWADSYLVGKYKTTSNQRSWIFFITPEGELGLIWTTAGSSATADAALSTAFVPLNPGRRALRVTLDVSPTPTATFYTSDTISGSWTQLGDSVTSLLGTGTSIYSSSAPLELGDILDHPTLISETYHGFIGRYNALEIRNGIGGTVVANPTFTGLTLGATSVADSHSNTFTFNGNTAVSDKRWRFHGEMSSLPPRWDTSGNDTYVTTDVNGILRRLRAQNTPLQSSIYRQISLNPATVAYWPCEDQSNATSFAAATPYTAPGTFPTGGANPAQSDLVVGSDALPTTNTKPVTFKVAPYNTSNGSTVFFILDLSSDSFPAANAILASVRSTGSANRWDFVYQPDGVSYPGGGIGVGVYDGTAESSTALHSPTGIVSNGVNGKVLLCSVSFRQNGSAIAWSFSIDEFGTGWSAFAFTDYEDTLIQSISSKTCGTASAVVIDPTSVTSSVTFGHVGVWNSIPADAESARIYNGYQSETAGERMIRLCDENDIDLRIIGSVTDTPEMGPQSVATLPDLLQECADADHGMLFECRDAMALCFRTRVSLYKQSPSITLDYSDGAITGTIEPTDDDQQIRNDVTVSRDGGSSARVTKTTGRLSVNAPPDGVGYYQDSQSYNLWLDGSLDDHAAWAVALGTVDEARYPSLGIDYTGEAFTSDSALIEEGLSLEIGDRLVLIDPPDSLPPDDISQLVQGYTETYGNYIHQQVFNCSPESPYHIAKLYTDRIDTSGSQVNTTANSTTTSLSVATTTGTIWTTNAGHFPFDIMVGGERMTVTTISGTSSPQTFTVTRSVNGIVKSQAAGTAVSLADPVFIGL